MREAPGFLVKNLRGVDSRENFTRPRFSTAEFRASETGVPLIVKVMFILYLFSCISCLIVSGLI